MICSACGHEGKRKKGKCSFCFEEIDVKGRRESDKELCTRIIQRLEKHIEKRDQIVASLAHIPRERKFVFALIDRSRNFLKAQSTDVGVTPADFLEGLLEKQVYKNNWYSPKINSHLMLQNVIGEMAQNQYRMLRDQHYKNLENQRNSVMAPGIEHIGASFSAL